MKRYPWPDFGRLVGVALVYIAAAKLGLSLAFTTEQVTAVWPPTGIALVAVLVLDYRIWPGILAGAFIANLLTNEPWYVALAIGVGNTGEALVGAVLLRRVAKLSPQTMFQSIRGVLSFAGLAAGVSTLVSATVGTTTLALAGLAPWPQYLGVWTVWWVGDMMGDLVIAPALLVLVYAGYRRRFWRHLLEAAALGALAFCASVIIFCSPATGPDWLPFRPFPYMIYPLLIWATLRFMQAGATGAVLLVGVPAVWGTVAGLGPFTDGASTDENLLYLQMFLFTASLTSLLVAAVVSERWRARAQLEEANQRATDILADVLDANPQRRYTRPK